MMASGIRQLSGSLARTRSNFDSSWRAGLILLFSYFIKKEKPSNLYSRLPSRGVDATLPLRTCSIAATTFGR
jgi:hypothetical protein